MRDEPRIGRHPALLHSGLHDEEVRRCRCSPDHDGEDPIKRRERAQARQEVHHEEDEVLPAQATMKNIRLFPACPSTSPRLSPQVSVRSCRALVKRATSTTLPPRWKYLQGREGAETLDPGVDWHDGPHPFARLRSPPTCGLRIFLAQRARLGSPGKACGRASIFFSVPCSPTRCGQRRLFWYSVLNSSNAPTITCIEFT